MLYDDDVPDDDESSALKADRGRACHRADGQITVQVVCQDPYCTGHGA